MFFYVVQALWPSRARLNSGRTLSESSEGCGPVVDMDMSEDFSMSGSPKKPRNRQDSAYMSQRDSMSGGPPETPSPDMDEEDQNGYVLPGESPKRGSRIVWCLLGLFRKDWRPVVSSLAHPGATAVPSLIVEKRLFDGMSRCGPLIFSDTSFFCLQIP